MAKAKKEQWGCKECGMEHPKWSGRCTGCGEWNTVVEMKISSAPVAIGKKRTMAGSTTTGVRKATKMTEIERKDYDGFSSGIGELDRIYGGKIPRGSVSAIAGNPGQGKSTIILQASGGVANSGKTVLYCAGEEAEYQIKERANRMGISSENLYFYNTENVDEVLDECERLKPDLLVIDSIQHLGNPSITSSLGSPTQIKECTNDLISLAKSTGVAVIIVAHITKSGDMAGPKAFEHMVDIVLFLDGDPQTKFKYLMTTKNRYHKQDLAVFALEGEGMIEIINPSEHLLADRDSSITGSTVVCIPGQKPILVEVQALVAATGFENAIPRRTSSGVNRDDLAILIAVLEKRCKVRLSTKDVYLNVVGGMKLEDKSSNLAVALAIYSSDKDISVDPYTTVIGEVGLGGEVRPVPAIEGLVIEAERNGFKTFILPKKNVIDAKKVAKKIKLIPIENLQEAINLVS